jgi:hypothetical protein
VLGSPMWEAVEKYARSGVRPHIGLIRLGSPCFAPSAIGAQMERYIPPQRLFGDSARTHVRLGFSLLPAHRTLCCISEDFYRLDSLINLCFQFSSVQLR